LITAASPAGLPLTPLFPFLTEETALLEGLPIFLVVTELPL